MEYGPQYGYGYAYPHPPPPDPPELPDGASAFPRWPAWYGPAALVVGLIVAVVAQGVLLAISGGSARHPPPAVVQIGTALQDAVFVGTAIFFAGRTLAPRTWHFGLRRVRLWRTVGLAALAMFSFLIFEIVYSNVVRVHEKQTIVQDLGAKHSTVALVGGAVLVIVIAPFAEEFFFRGFFYRALRTRMGVALAAIIDGLVFAAIHLGGSSVAVLPVLAVLGVLFCVVYERTGTLFATIGMHSLNNFLAYGSATGRWAVAGAIAAAMIGACVAVPGMLQARAAPALR
ncbi:MAG: protease family protein [Thermoleophilaceae bacterium]|nr:protease family protein [Thermoleophilaceae bacterium]